MTARLLLDTNVLIYAYDRSEQVKQLQARQLLDDAHRWGVAALSTQVLAEFVTTATRKLARTLEPHDVHESVATYCRNWTVLPVTPAIVLEAVRGMQTRSMSYWDAQIWATAKMAGLVAILSEDFNSGATIEGVTFANPFAPGFDLRAWLR